MRIENYRSIHELECGFEELTTLVGPNGAGKSNVLRALDWFFNGDRDSLSTDDVFRGAATQRVRVRVEFSGLTEEDRAALGPKYCPTGTEDSFTAWRTWTEGEDKITGKAMALPAFEEVRSLEGATAKKTAYETLRSGSMSHLDLPRWTSVAAGENAMDEFERAHPELLSEAEVSATHFFGFNGRGALSAVFDYVFVAADLRAQDEVSGSKSSLLSRILGQAVNQDGLNEAASALSDSFRNQYAELVATHIGKQLDAVASELSAEIQAYAAGRSVTLPAGDLVLRPAPGPVEVHVTDSCIETPVFQQGHGFQRTLLIAALTVLSRRGRSGSSPGHMFLAIEEPELFQHPTQAKAFASVLRSLAAGGSNQVAYATHSPYFVEPRFFDQVRRISLTRDKAESAARSVVTAVTIDAVSERLEGFVPVKALQRRWDQVCLRYLPEALFAERVILVEGEEDAAVLEGVGYTVNALAVQGICVAPTSGKANLMIPFAILEGLGIPVVMVADNDSGCADRMRRDGKADDNIDAAVKEHKARNRALCRFVGADEEDFPVGAVGGPLTFVPDTMETLLASDLPAWDLSRQKVIDEGRGVDGKNAATYALATKECDSKPSGELLALVSFCTAAA